jgi:hypothetical protein
LFVAVIDVPPPPPVTLTKLPKDEVPPRFPPVLFVLCVAPPSPTVIV